MLERGKLHTEGGKLVIYVQHHEPSDPKQHQNWLPAPKEGFCFTVRFYGPYTPVVLTLSLLFSLLGRTLTWMWSPP
jgi:hypothetical protein